MEKNIARIMTRLGRKSQSWIGTALEKYNLTAAEQPFFMALQRREGMTQEDLTAMVGVDKAATARAVKSLEEKGYLIRKQDETDRRQNRIYPTERAKNMAPEVRETLFGFNRRLTAGLDAECLEQVYEALLRMEENLKG